MKITVYTITDCEFSKQEKEYLKSHSLQFEEKNLETNREFLTEMLAVSNNFAGTPVTKIEKDDGQIAVLKGFTKEEFDQTFGFVQPQATPSTAPSDSSNPVPPTPAQPKDTPTPSQPSPTPPSPGPTPPPVQEPVQTPPVAPFVPPAEPPSPPTPPAPPQHQPADPQLNSILNDLQAKVNEDLPQSQTAQAPQSTAGAGGLPNIPEPNFGPQQ